MGEAQGDSKPEDLLNLLLELYAPSVFVLVCESAIGLGMTFRSAAGLASLSPVHST